MDLSDLRIFKAVVSEGGVTRAAERLHRVQSNVTTRIRQLEEDLGVALFIREGKRLHLAPAGQVLLGYADRLLALADEATAAVQDPRPRGTFRLGSIESTAAVRLPAPLSEFHRRYPDVVLELRTGSLQDLSAALLTGELDAAILVEPIADAAFDKVPAFKEELVIVSRADHPAIDDENLPQTMIAFEHGCPYRKRFDTWYERCGGIPERTIELSSYHAMLGCVVAGMGAAMMPRSILTTFPECKRLRIHALSPGEGSVEIYLVWRKGGTSPKVQAFRQILDQRRRSGHSKAERRSDRKYAAGSETLP